MYYKFKKILKYRKYEFKKKYLIRWKRYISEENNWKF